MNKSLKLRVLLSRVQNGLTARFGTGSLTCHTICSILEIEKPKGPDKRYGRLRFAKYADKNSVAVISPLEPEPVPDEELGELADFAVSKGAKLLIAAKQYRDYPTLIVDDPYAS